MRYGWIVGAILLLGATTSNGTEIVYKTLRGGEEVPDADPVVVLDDGTLSRIRTETSGTPIATAPDESGFIDSASGQTWRTALFPDGSRCSVPTEFDSLAQFTMTADIDTILDYPCTKAETSIRSNRIEVWVTDEPGITSSPHLSLVVPGQLILKFVQNGDYTLVASEIRADAETAALQPDDWGEIVDLAEYRARVTESYVTRIEIFDSAQINFDNELVTATDLAADGVLRFSKGTMIARKVLLPDLPDETMVFARLTEISKGDAYDRTGSVFLIPTSRETSLLDAAIEGVEQLPVILAADSTEYQGVVATESYLPPLELIRFITPFGIGEFNARSKVRGLEWENEATYEMDLTDLLPVLRGEVWVGAFIGNYDKGGHDISLELEYFPWNKELTDEPKQKSWTLPVFNTLNVLVDSGQSYATIFAEDTLEVRFEVPEGVTDCALRYVTTGHGGWGGGDEFNQKMNEIFLDGERIAGFVPWRSDCGTFRTLNPSSGNFWNGMSSSDFSRSGWCPGTTVSPVVLPLPELTAGTHTLSVAIPMGEREGGSFSSWNVSGVLLGKFEKAGDE